MASRVKEDEKNERTIRGLLKLPENRRCINCNNLGPQYVCTNFWTFVCTTCSGIHREFTHRVKSISMAKFTSQEVNALQGGGNQRAKEIYFKELDPQRHSFPDSSNVERLRDFIKHVYVDRRYSGERNSDKPPRAKSYGEKEEFNETRRSDVYQGGSRSPPYEDTYDRRYSGKSSPGGRSFEERSPGFDQESRQYGDFKKSPIRPEIVNDWRREDRFGNGKKVEDHRVTDGDSKLEGRSPERLNSLDQVSPPMVRPVREILGESVSPLRVIEPPKNNVIRRPDGSVQTQRTASSSSLGSVEGNKPEATFETSGSLIDFDADPSPLAPVVPQPLQTIASQSFAQPVNTTNDNNWASFDVAAEAMGSQAPSNVNTLESVLSQLSVSGSVPLVSGTGGLTAAPAGNTSVLASHGDLAVASVGPTQMFPYAAGAPSLAPVSVLSTLPVSGASAAVPGQAAVPVDGTTSLVGVPHAAHLPNMQHQQQPSLFPNASVQHLSQQFKPLVAENANNQAWNPSVDANVQGPPSHSAVQTPQAVLNPVHQVTSGVVARSSSVEVNPSGRKELPADLFATTYSSFPAPVPGWQTGPPRGMNYTMQYNNAVPTANFLQLAKSSNPFDLNSEPHQIQAPFPSMASLQGALPTGQPPSGLMRSSSVDTPSSAWMSVQTPFYTSQLPPQASYPSTVPPSAYVGQQLPSNMQFSRPYGVANFSNEGAAYGYLNMDQQMVGRFSAPATPNPFPSSGGNPFG